MAKAQALDWKAFMGGEVKPKHPKQEVEFFGKDAMIGGILAAGTIMWFAHAAPALAMGHGVIAVSAMAPDFSSSLHQATAPIHDLIKGFAHEIYAIFMGWGAIEAMIGRPQQGFARMKTATLGYILLYWVPTIIDLVNKARPGV